MGLDIGAPAAPAPGASQSSLGAYESSLIDHAVQQKLYDNIQWKKRLFYFQGRFFGEKGIFDDREFYFSKHGKSNAKEEMVASLEAFLKPDKKKIKFKTDHPRCLFPSRWSWLKKNLQIDESKIIPVECPDVDRFVKFTQYTTVSLVFTNYFIGSPASIFGHSFLKLGRDENQGHTQGGLLDDSANFAAMVSVFNPLTYPLKGLSGFYQGRFSVVPYFQKVQEYNNYEQRDLWEYGLDLTPAEISDLTLMIFELGFFSIDYYYLDDNCSFILLTVLDAIRPSLHVSEKFSLYAIPADTLKSVVHAPGLVKKIDYKPSAFSRYVGRVEKLPREEVRTLVKIAKGPVDAPLQFPSECDEACQARIMDTLIEYIDYSEKLAGSLEAVKYKKIRQETLVRRSKNQTRPEPYDYLPKSERPDRGHESSAIGLQGGASDNGHEVLRFQWKPALHDLFDSDEGYSDQIQIGFLDTNITWFEEKKKVFVDDIKFLELVSLPRSYPLHSPWSWKFQFANDNLFVDMKNNEMVSKYYVSLGIGKNARFFNDRLLIYGLASIETGHASRNLLDWYVGVVPEIGINLKLSNSWKFGLSHKHYELWGDQDFHYEQGQARLTYFLNVNNEFFASTIYESKTLFGHIGYRMYY